MVAAPSLMPSSSFPSFGFGSTSPATAGIGGANPLGLGEEQLLELAAAMVIAQFLQAMVEQAVTEAWQQFLGQALQGRAPMMAQRGAPRGLRAQDFAGYQDPRSAALARQGQSQGGGRTGGSTGGSGAAPAPSGPAPSMGPATQGSAALMVQRALEQNGDRYKFGAEVNLNDANPNTFDCSELVQWAVHQAGGSIPDGSQNQRAWVRQHGKTLSIEEALRTPGALLFNDHHVAISLGDGRTIEAMGTNYGVRIANARGRDWREAGLVPGLSY